MKIRYLIEYILYKTFTFPLFALPRSMRIGIGSFLGFVFYALSSRHRKIALRNLDIAFPDSTLQWKKDTAKAAFRHVGRLFIDMNTYYRINEKNLDKYVSSIEGEDILKQVFAKHTNVLFITFHFGNWEMMSIITSLKGYKLSAIARQLDNPYLEKEILRSRLGTGSEIIYKTNAMRKILRQIKNGWSIGFLTDQNQIDKEGVFVDFFGLPACTTPVVAQLALKLKLPIIPCYSIPEKNNRFRVIFKDEIKIKETGDFDKDVVALTQKYTRFIEDLISDYPEYWLCMHKRWNTRPPGEKGVYDNL